MSMINDYIVGLFYVVFSIYRAKSKQTNLMTDKASLTESENTCSAIKPSAFSGSVGFLKAPPKTGQNVTDSTFLYRSPVFSLLSPTEHTNHCICASKKASAGPREM